MVNNLWRLGVSACSVQINMQVRDPINCGCVSSGNHACTRVEPCLSGLGHRQ
jgi:hypothetical protein